MYIVPVVAREIGYAFYLIAVQPTSNRTIVWWDKGCAGSRALESQSRLDGVLLRLRQLPYSRKELAVEVGGHTKRFEQGNC